MRRPVRKNPRRPRILALTALVAASAMAFLAGLASSGTGPGPDVDMASSPSRSGDAAAAPFASPRESAAERPKPARQRPRKAIEWRDSVSVGTHSSGSLKRGVLLPAEGRGWVSWDPILKRSPNRAWRRWGSDRMIRATLSVMRQFRRAHPGAPRVAIGDLSRPRGGDFGPQYGLIGHASHQNGLDVDVYYPRLDRRPSPPEGPDQVDRRLAQKLVDLFVAAGAELVFVGPSLGLTGPPDVVVPLANHDGHLHARLPLEP